MNGAWRNWWRRECGPGDVLRLSLPLVVSTASWSVMTFIDRLFLTWWSADEMGATLSAGSLLWTLFAFPLGVICFVNTFVAQYHGAGRPQRIGLVLGQGVRLAGLAMPLYLLLALFAPELFLTLGHQPTLAGHEASYFQIMSWGVGATLLSTAYSAFYTGRGVMSVVMAIDVASAVLNCVLDYAWIFGRFGFPAAGLQGAAWASVVALWAKVPVYIWLLRRRELRTEYGLDEGNRFDRPLLLRLLRFGGPNGVQFLLEGLAFTIFTLFVGRFGEMALSATTLAFSVNMVAFVPMVGVATAVSTLVGQQLGAERPELAERAGWSGVWIALAYNAVFAGLYVSAPRWFLAAHGAAANPVEFAALEDLTVVLLRFVAAYCLFDAAQIVFSSAIKGAGDTRFVLGTTVLTSTGAVVIGQIGSLYGEGQLLWWWIVLTGWIFALAVAYGGRFVSGVWKRIRVIEPTPE